MLYDEMLYDMSPFLGPWPCPICRFNPECNNYQAGGDCANCDKNAVQFMILKDCNQSLCAGCEYEEDPCNIECVECQDNRNWTKAKTCEGCENLHQKLKNGHKLCELCNNQDLKT